MKYGSGSAKVVIPGLFILITLISLTSIDNGSIYEIGMTPDRVNSTVLAGIQIDGDYQEPPCFEITIRKNVFLYGEPVDITATILNNGSESINVSEPGLGVGSLTVGVATANGINWQANPVYGYPYSADILELKPNESIMNIFDFTTIQFGDYIEFYLKDPGEYSLNMIYVSKSSNDSRWVGNLTSNTLNFTIKEVYNNGYELPLTITVVFLIILIIPTGFAFTWLKHKNRMK